MGNAGAFSFYPGKNMGACGEAGAVTTNDEGLAQKVRMLRDHGQSEKYFHDVEGFNGRCDALQALSPGAFATLMDDARSLVELDGRPLVTGPSHEVRESSGSQAMGA